MRKRNFTLIIFCAAAFLSISTGSRAWGADNSSTSGATTHQVPAPNGGTAGATPDDSDQTGPERVDTQNIREKYWARGNESEIGVVQNRLYSKAGKFEFSLLGGFDFTDPMLSVYVAGGRLGYHFSEYFSAHLLAFKAFSGPSSSQTELLSDKTANQIGTVLNTNEPQYYVGGEAQWSLLYGKLSVVGAAIIHYDLHFVVGLGTMNTETGHDFEYHVGIGQQFFLSQSMFLNVDYRLMMYHEEIPDKVVTNDLGNIVGTRENMSSVITVGVGFLFGAGAK